MSDRAPLVTFRQVRGVSAFSRPMSKWDAFIYNFLAMGVIFPWAYLWGPASFPGGDIEFAIIVTLVAQIPISLSYCYLATVLPVTGGDYVYQTRAFGKWGFVCVMSGFVIWILQWVALSGWLLATLGIAPWLVTTGVLTNSPRVTGLGVEIQKPAGVFLISVILAVVTYYILIRGLRLYTRIQRYLFASTVLAICVVLYVYWSAGSGFETQLNGFVKLLLSQVPSNAPDKLASSFVSFLKSDVTATGFNISPGFSFIATLGIVPIAWTSLQWATYSVEQSTEIAEADRFRWQALMLIGSAVAVAVALFLLAHMEHTRVGTDFMTAASAAYWLQRGSPATVNLVKNILQPFPNILAMASSGSILLNTLIAFGFIANAFQVTCNCFIGMTRILVAMGGDGIFPPSMAMDRVDPRRHAPVRAHTVYLIGSLFWIAAYNFVPHWTDWTLGVTFACGYVFAFSALAATRIPSKMKDLWLNSEICHRRSTFLGHPLFIKAVGYVGFLFGITMVLAYLIVPQLGLTGLWPYLLVFAIIALSYGIYALARARTDLIERALRQAPEELEQFYMPKNK